MRTFIVLVTTLLVGLSAAPGHAQKKAKPACGLTFLPFVEGASWTYEMNDADDEDAKKAPRGVTAAQPESITIAVKSIESRGDEATIQLEESFRKVVVSTTITCTKKSTLVDPNSFLWAGEPGGGIHMKLTNLKRKGESYPGKKGLKGGTELFEEFKASVERSAAPKTKAKIRNGTVEMEREAKVGSSEPVILADGTDLKATRVEVSLSGRGQLEGEKGSPREMAAGARSMLWFAPKVGLVKVSNRLNQTWVLKR